MLKLAIIMVGIFALIALAGNPALAGACVNKDPEYTQCTEYPVGADESMIKDNCKKFHQKYVAKCPTPKHKYCVTGDKKTGRIFTWGTEVDVETCGSGTWHP